MEIIQHYYQPMPPRTEKPFRFSAKCRKNNFCVNCVHYIPNEAYYDLPRCRKSIQHRIDPVTGVTTQTIPISCHTMREFDRDCGPDGDWYQSKNPDHTPFKHKTGFFSRLWTALMFRLLK